MTFPLPSPPPSSQLIRPLTKAGYLRSSYTIEEVSQLRDIIEDINGVSYR
jgi:hypothetical protein